MIINFLNCLNNLVKFIYLTNEISNQNNNHQIIQSIIMNNQILKVAVIFQLIMIINKKNKML